MWKTNGIKKTGKQQAAKGKSGFLSEFYGTGFCKCKESLNARCTANKKFVPVYPGFQVGT
jgi:hypothetical protein